MNLPKIEKLKHGRIAKTLVAGLIVSTLTLSFFPALSFIGKSNTNEMKLNELNISGKSISLGEEKPVFKANDEVKITLNISKDVSLLGRVSSFVSSATTVFGNEDATLHANIYDSKGKLSDSFDFDYSGGQEIDINSAKLTPGKYTLRVFDTGNTNRFIEQDFTWGVLAINTNKSIYKEGETAELAIAVLDDEGNMVCDASLQLKISNSQLPATGSQLPTTLSTQDGSIKVSEWCAKKEYTLVPDYAATLSGVKPGIYEMQLTAETKNGTYTITDSFEVKNTQELTGNDSPYFDIERISATRIFPESAYPMMFQVNATEDFKGTVTETVPASFKVSGLSLFELDEYFGHSNFEDDGVTVPLKITEKDNEKILEWQVDWKKGQIYNLHYKYQTPNVSPEFYTVGPLRLEEVFTETRTWSLAIDVATTMILLWDSGNGTLPDGWTCISCSGGAYENIYPRGASAYSGTTGGAANHTHTITYVAASETSTDAIFFDAGNDTNMNAHTHTHGGITGTNVVSASNDPAYRTLELIKSTGLPSTIPQNVIAMFDSTTLPNSDWTAYTSIDGKFLKGGATTADGSSDTHTHDASATTNAASGTVAVENTSSLVAGPPLSHTHSCSATTPATDIKPPYYNVVFAYVNNAAGTTLPAGLISMFDDTAPTNWTRVSAWDGYFLRGSSTSYGLGSSTTHTTHSNLALSCAATSATTNYDNTPVQGGSTPSHTHTMSVSFGTASTTALPVYRDTVFAKRDEVITVSGYIRQSDESTADTTESSTLMNITVEGGSTYTPALDANGFYTQSFTTPTSGNAILVFVNDGGDYEGSAVTVSGGADISLDLYEDRFIARSDKTATSIVLQDIVDVNTTDADDLVPTVTTGGITIASGKELHIYTGDTFDPGGTVTTQTAGNLHLDDSSVMYLDTATNTIAGDITIDTSANLHADTNTTVSGGDITATGTLSSSGGTLTLGATGTISGGGTITFTDLAVSNTFTTTIGSSITISGGDMTTTGTSAYSYSGTPTVTINGTGNLGGGGTTSLYNLVIGDGNNSQTTTVASTLTVNNDLNIYATETLAMGANNVTVGSASISGSGDITVNGATSQSSGTLTILSNTSDAVLSGSGTLTAYNLTIGNGTNTVSFDAETNDVAIDLGGTFTNTASATFKASSTDSFTIGGSFVNSATGTFTANSGTVTFDATSGTPTITSGGDAFNDLSIDNAGTTLTWTLSDALDVNDDLLIDTSNTLNSGTNYAVNIAGDFTVNGTYTANSNTTTLDGAGGTTQAVSGTITFYNLSITTSSTRTVTFAAGQTFTIASGGNLTMTGTSCTALLIIKSSSAGSAFTFVNNDATPTASYTEFTDTTVTTNLFSSGTGLTDGGGNTGITFDSACIGASSSGYATAYSFQRKTFYDETNSVYWMLYYDGAQIKSKYSTDGTAWTLSNPIAKNTNDFSVWYQSIDGSPYIFVAIADAGNYDIVVERGALTSSSVTWSGSYPIALAGTSSGDAFSNAFISADDSGYLWVMGNQAGNKVMAADSTTTGSTTGTPTWSSLAFNTPGQLSSEGTTTNIYGNLVPLGSSNDMYASFVIDTALQGCIWDDSDGAWENSSGGGCSSGQTLYYAKATSADNQPDLTTSAVKEGSTTLGSSTQTYSLGATNTSFYILTDVANKKYTSDRSMTTNTTGEKRNLDIAVDANGNQVAVWEDSRNSQANSGTWSASGNMISSRKNYSATLLGNGKVLVAGGSNGSILSHSEIYDPSAGTWSATGKMITNRYIHTATLLNNGKVLVAGGETDTSVYISHSEIYDPSAGTWSATGNMITARNHHTATLLGNGKVIVAGGISATGVYLSQSEIYDPSTGTWSATGNMITSRYDHTATLLGNGKVLVAGGNNATGAYLSHSEIYDPSARTWSATGNMITKRNNHTATLLNNGKVLVAGGWNPSYLSRSEIYDPSAGTWSATGNMITNRANHTATLLGNGKVLVAGGNNGATLSHSEIYDPSSGTWSATGNMITNRADHTATLLGNGKVLVAGGGTLSHSEIYNPATFDVYAQKYNADGTAQWNSGVDIKVNSDDGNRSTASPYPSLYNHVNPKVKLDTSGNAVVVWSEQRNNVYGGDIYSQKLQGTDGAKLWPSSSTGTWSATGNMITARQDHTATLLNNGKVLVAGGYNSVAYLSHSEIYDPSVGTWSATGNMITNRNYHTATLLGNGKVLVAGGGNGVYLSHSEIYDPSSGTWSATGNMITNSTGHTATLLGNGKVLVAGGYNGDYLSHSEIYDPSSGTWSVTGNMITNRTAPTATLLGNGKVLVAGGQNVAYLSHSEIYDPSTGTWSATGNMITNIQTHTATLLGNGKVLVAGGFSGSSISQSEIFDPATGTWSASGNMITRMYRHTATLLGNGKVLVAGGNGGAFLSHSEIYTPPSDISVSNDGSAGNWDGYSNPYYPEIKGYVGRQSNPALALDSSGNAIIGWEDDRYSQISRMGLSDPASSPSVNLAFSGSGNGGGSTTNNSDGARQAVLGVPKKIMGQKLSSATGAKNWGDDIDLVNKNAPDDLILSASGDSNSNPVVEVDTSDDSVIVAWDTNAAEKNENGLLKRESNIYSQKFNSSGASLWGGSWSATGNMITNRAIHTATLLNNGKVLVAGGAIGINRLSHSEIYDPSSGTWSATGNMITNKTDHTATLLGNGKVLVAGGYSYVSGSFYLSRSEIYDPSSGTWTVTGNMITSIYKHTATLLGNGKVLVAGGYSYDSGAILLSQSEIYDPSSGTWSATGNMITNRFSHTATLLGNGKVLVAGGSPDGTSYLSHSEIYNPSAGTWSATGNMITNRQSHSATLLGNGKVLVAGGYNGSRLSHSEIYDPSAGTWSATGNMITNTNGHTATLLNNGKVLVAGGYSDVYLSQSEIYDPSVGTWSATGNMITNRQSHTATLLGNGKVLLAGGGNGAYLSHSELYSIDQMVNSGADLADQSNPDVKLYGSNLYYAWQGIRGSDAGGSTSGGSNRGGLSTQIFGQKTNNPTSGTLTASWPDGTAGTWSATGNMITNRNNHTATLLGNGKVLVAGGSPDGTSYLSHSEIYDPSAGTWSATGNMVTNRSSHTATLLGNGKVLVAGGWQGSYRLSHSEIYNPSSGTWSASGNMATDRYYHTATLLSNGKVLVAGGSSSTSPYYLSHSEIYDPSTNTWLVAAGMNTVRTFHTATLLGNGKVLVAGGMYADNLRLSHSEIYDPSTGTWSATGNMITNKSNHTATLLGNGKVLVAGGSSGVSAYLSHSEIYDPSSGTWSATGNMITNRSAHTATLLGNGKVLVAGGSNGTAISHSEIYDPVAGTWSATGNMVTNRYAHTATLLGNGKVLVAGGFGGATLSRSEIYTPAKSEMLLSHDLAISADKEYPNIAIDSGNPVIAWADRRPVPGNFTSATTPALSSDWNIYMQKYDGTTGAPLWPAGATTGGYTSPYAVADIRADTTSGTTGTLGGSHYSGRPSIGIASSTSEVYVGYEDNRNDTSAASGYCGYSNTSSLVRSCIQTYGTAQESQLQDVDWYAYFDAVNPSTPDINVEVGVAESDGYLLEKRVDHSDNYTSGTGLQTVTFTSGGANAPPSDTVGNMSFRRYKMMLTRVSGSVDIAYDNTGDETALAIGSAGSADSIDTVPTGIANNLSSVSDPTNNDVHLLYVDDETTDQISYKRWHNSSLAWDSSPAGVATGSGVTYPSLAFEYGNEDLTAYWIDTSTDYLHYRQCDTSAAGVNLCSDTANWASPDGGGSYWKNGINFYTWVTSGYRGLCATFAMYTIDGGTIGWDSVPAVGGGATSFTQNDFEWFETADSVTLTNAWPPGTGDNLTENQEFTQVPATNDPLAPDDKVRVQMNFTYGGCGGGLTQNTQRFQLQYATSSAGLACSSLSDWRAVGGKGNTIEDFRLFDEASIGNSTQQVNNISSSDAGAEGYYSEINFTDTNPNAVASGADSEWDWPVENYKAQENAIYCFRMVKHDGSSTATAFDAYHSDSYPRLTTNPGTEPLMRHGKFFQNDTLRGLFWAD